MSAVSVLPEKRMLRHVVSISIRNLNCSSLRRHKFVLREESMQSRVVYVSELSFPSIHSSWRPLIPNIQSTSTQKFLLEIYDDSQRLELTLRLDLSEFTRICSTMSELPSLPPDTIVLECTDGLCLNIVEEKISIERRSDLVNENSSATIPVKRVINFCDNMTLYHNHLNQLKKDIQLLHAQIRSCLEEDGDGKVREEALERRRISVQRLRERTRRLREEVKSKRIVCDRRRRHLQPRLENLEQAEGVLRKRIENGIESRDRVLSLRLSSRRLHTSLESRRRVLFDDMIRVIPFDLIHILKIPMSFESMRYQKTPEETINSALSFFSLVLKEIIRIVGVPSLYTLQLRGSRSTILQSVIFRDSSAATKNITARIAPPVISGTGGAMRYGSSPLRTNGDQDSQRSSPQTIVKKKSFSIIEQDEPLPLFFLKSVERSKSVSALVASGGVLRDLFSALGMKLRGRRAVSLLEPLLLILHHSGCELSFEVENYLIDDTHSSPTSSSDTLGWKKSGDGMSRNSGWEFKQSSEYWG